MRPTRFLIALGGAALVAALSVSPAWSGAGLGEGDAAAEFEGKEFVNTEPVSLKSLRGRVVFLELFSTTWGPCKSQVGHLDKLAAEMADKGLSVIAITKQSRAAVDTFIEETGAKHPIVIESTDSMRAYGSTSYPTSFLIDTGGRILWRGHPGNLTDDVVLQQLEKAKILPEFPKALSAARKALDKGHYADAAKKVAKDLDGDGLEEADKAVAQKIAEWLAWYGESTLEGAAKDAEKGNVYEAFLAYEQIADQYKGSELGDKAKGLAKDLESDKDRKNEIKAGEKLAKIKLELAGITSAKKAIKALEPLTKKKYAETKAGKEAAEMIAEYEKAEG